MKCIYIYTCLGRKVQIPEKMYDSKIQEQREHARENEEVVMQPKKWTTTTKTYQ